MTSAHFKSVTMEMLMGTIPFYFYVCNDETITIASLWLTTLPFSTRRSGVDQRPIGSNSLRIVSHTSSPPRSGTEDYRGL
ncbi:hypothetical protein ACFQZT_10105 [Paenibacillus sp. GCM10027628]|uniref:hypothetical protein n=1 Tax=Paenibacillus sp. GCM10027628 TaxID=3273413 RepID=UPI0036366FD5